MVSVPTSDLLINFWRLGPKISVKYRASSLKFPYDISVRISGSWNKAYLSAKALLHLAIQRKCIGHESNKSVFKGISDRHPVMGTHYEGDSDLESTLGIIDRVFGDFEPMYWQNFTFSIPHHAWMGHILLYRVWDVLRKGEALPDDIKEFVLHSLRLEPPPAPIVADRLLIIGLLLGIKLHVDDLLAADKR